MSKKKSSPAKGKHKKIVVILWSVFGVVIVSIALVFALIANGVIGYMPPIKDLENPIDKYATQVYSSDSELLGTYSQSRENRIYSAYTDLSPYLTQALIATEDSRFESHSGIDMYAFTRALVKRGILQQKSGGGGSTITQQLAKQLFSPSAENVIERLLQKPIEWVIAVQLESYYTKDDIINLYLNKFDFLNNAVGIQTASKVYFNKSAKDLTIEEAAMLIGMCKNPSQFNPIRRPEATTGRRNVVLGQMYKNNYITKAELDSLEKTPLVLNFKRVDHKDGLAPYFREYLRLTMTAKKPEKSSYANWQIEQYKRDSVQWETNPLYGWCYKNKKADGSYYNLYTDGLKIYSTIDSRMQRYAEESVEEHLGKYLQPLFNKEKAGRSYAPYAASDAQKVNGFLDKAMKQSDRYRSLKNDGVSEKEIDKIFKTPIDMKVFTWKGETDTIMSPMDSIRYHKAFLRAGFMAMNTSGQVKAYIGGPNFKYFQYDMVNVGRRQVGSTIKPFLYTLAMQDGRTPCDEILHVAQTLITEDGREWTPRNANNKRIGEMVSIKWGLQNSDNWITAAIMKTTNPYNFVRMLHSFGITGKIDPVVSLCLGPCEVSLSEMVGAYTSFANRGVRANPLYVTRIEDSYGNILATFTPQMQEVFDEITSVKILDMLRAVIDGGSGSRIRYAYKVQGPMGGKTGTTNDNSDGWFMTFTPQLSIGCWVGGEERSIHFDRMAYGQGASMALPIPGLFLQKVYGDPKTGYGPDKQFEAVKNAPNPCSKSESLDDFIDEQPVGLDDMFN